MMLWYVNPYEPEKAINLARVTTIQLQNSMIWLGYTVWSFDSKEKASRVYEEMIRLCQEPRYRTENK